MYRIVIKFLILKMTPFAIFVDEERILDVESREADPCAMLMEKMKAEILRESEEPITQRVKHNNPYSETWIFSALLRICKLLFTYGFKYNIHSNS